MLATVETKQLTLTVAPVRTLETLEGILERGLQTFYEVGDALQEVRDRRLYRDAGYGTFEDYCSDRWGISRSRAYRLMDAAEVVGLLPIGDIPANEAQARELVPLKDDEEAVLEVWREVRQKYPGRVTAGMIKRLLTNRARCIEREEAAKRRQQGPLPDLPPDVAILTGDMRKLGAELEPESVDAIVTDPPYPKEYLPLWSDLARLAGRVLKPGGYLVAYSGQICLPEVMAMLSEHLRYCWLAGVYLHGPHPQIWPRRVRNALRVVLIYQRPPIEARDRWFTDLVDSPAPSKEYHEWGQAVEPVRYYLEQFTEPGDLVLDPFLGGGTTAVACVQTSRRVIGFEADSDKADVARLRVSGDN